MTLRPFSPLRYATNDRGGNGKNRSVAGVAERRARVEAARARGRFAYSKWELSAAHALYEDAGSLDAGLHSRG